MGFSLRALIVRRAEAPPTIMARWCRSECEATGNGRFFSTPTVGRDSARLERQLGARRQNPTSVKL